MEDGIILAHSCKTLSHVITPVYSIAYLVHLLAALSLLEAVHPVQTV